MLDMFSKAGKQCQAFFLRNFHYLLSLCLTLQNALHLQAQKPLKEVLVHLEKE